MRNLKIVQYPTLHIFILALNAMINIVHGILLFETTVILYQSTIINIFFIFLLIIFPQIQLDYHMLVLMVILYQNVLCDNIQQIL